MCKMDPDDNFGQKLRAHEVIILSTTLCLMNEYCKTYIKKSPRMNSAFFGENGFVSCCMETPIDSITCSRVTTYIPRLIARPNHLPWVAWFLTDFLDGSDMHPYPFKKLVLIVVATCILHNYMQQSSSHEDVYFSKNFDELHLFMFKAL